VDQEECLIQKERRAIYRLCCAAGRSAGGEGETGGAFILSFNSAHLAFTSTLNSLRELLGGVLSP